MHPGVNQTQHNQPVKRGDYPAVFSIGVTSLGVLCAVVGPTIYEGCSSIAGQQTW